MNEHEQYKRPSDKRAPMFGEATTYGSSERRVYPCLICSDHNAMTLVTPDSLAEHAAGHAAGYAEYQRSLFEPVPEGWEYVTEDGFGWITSKADLGELGMITYDGEQVGGYYLPGRGQFRPFDTLAEAVHSAENGGAQ